MTYTKEEIQQKVLAMWGASSPEILASSSFTAAERYYLFRGAVLDRIMTAPEKRDPCATATLVSISPVHPAATDGSKSEIWLVDVCSVKQSVTATLSASQRANIEKMPLVTKPAL